MKSMWNQKLLGFLVGKLSLKVRVIGRGQLYFKEKRRSSDAAKVIVKNLFKIISYLGESPHPGTQFRPFSVSLAGGERESVLWKPAAFPGRCSPGDWVASPSSR